MVTKPPSLSKRPGRAPPEGANRYRLLFSIWNSSTLSYVTWQHMQTHVVVRNSFHMLPLEEKNWRRQQYSRTRKGELTLTLTLTPTLALAPTLTLP